MTPRWWATPRGAATIVAMAALAAFAGSLRNGFTYDEGLVILGAQRFLQSGAFGVLFSKSYFAYSLEGTWRPVCTFTYMLDAAVSMSPAVFKVDSLLWHIVAAWLLMALGRRLLPPERRRWVLLAGLFFVVHPLTTETVDNASFREDSLVTVFTLATLVLALDGRRALALLCFALGLLSKESAVMAPALLMILRLAGFDGHRRRPDGPRLPPAGRGPPGLDGARAGAVRGRDGRLSGAAVRPHADAGRLRAVPGRDLRRDVDRAAGHLGARPAPAGLAVAALRRVHRVLPVRAAALGAGRAGRTGGPGLPGADRAWRCAGARGWSPSVWGGSCWRCCRCRT